jgi:hypothetical protein
MGSTLEPNPYRPVIPTGHCGRARAVSSGRTVGKIDVSEESALSLKADQIRVGLVVAFAALGELEEHATRLAWSCAVDCATHWEPAFSAFGLESVTAPAQGADILVYLGESSRFQDVAGEASQETPVVFVKSTVEDLLVRAAGAAPRYRMCTGVTGIAQALASVTPMAPSVNWQTLPWPESVASLTHLDPAELSYVNASVGAFREACARRGIPWLEGLPEHGAFSVFLTMHDPAAAVLSDTALRLWPESTVLAADGMVSTRAPGGTPWPEQLIRVRHWSPQGRSDCNRRFRKALRDESLPDFDSAGMLFGTMCFLNAAFASGGQPARLDAAGRHPGPLGPVGMTPVGRPQPERIIVLRGEQSSVVTVE